MTPPAFQAIHTGRLTLRPLGLPDAPALAAYRRDPEVARYQSWGSDYSEAQARALIVEMQGRQPGQPGWFQFGVVERVTGRLIGDLGLCVLEPRQGEIGFTLARPAQGQGYAREALTALLGLAFGELALHRLVAGTDPRNEKSAALLRRLGFRHEGRFLESFCDGDAWLDDDRYALLAREWAGRPAPTSPA